MSRVIIAGGGLAGCLAALALAKRRPRTELLLIEQGECFGGNHTWSFFDTDVDPVAQWVLDDVERRRWATHEVRFPRRSRYIAIGYNSIRSASLDRAVRAALRPDQYRLGARIDSIGPSSVEVSGETIGADAVLDARGPAAMPGLELGWQKFVGRYYRFPQGHGVAKPMIMDATVEQKDGYRFIYQLPVSATDLLIEDTYYSASSMLDHRALGDGIDAIADRIGSGAEIVEEESGVLPIVIDGDVETLWDGQVPPLGLRGGFFHPTTSYSLPDAVANAALLAQQSELTTKALYSILHARAQRLWQERGYFRLLNRMLFRAAEPDQAYRVLEHFYRLPPAVIARFYGARLTGLDKLRILTGKPPVPIGRAFSALRGKAA